MPQLFISNLNCFGHQQVSSDSASNQNSKAKSIVNILHDYSVNNVDNLTVKYYDNPDVDPKAVHNFVKFLAGKTMMDSVVKFADPLTQDALEGGVVAVFASNMPNAKYLVCPHINAEYIKDGDSYSIPLIIKIDDLDAESGIMTGSLVTGRYDAAAGTYHLDGSIDTKHCVPVGSQIIWKDTLFFALSDIPDLSQISQDANYNVFVLKSDCPAIREDAKAGDVFIFGQSKYNEEKIDSSELVDVLDSWIKLFSLEDKIDTFLNYDDRKINLLVGGNSFELTPVICMSDLYLTSSKLAVREMELQNDIAPNRRNAVLSLPPEDAAHIYLYQELYVEGIQGYDAAGENPVEGSNLRLMVVSFDNNSGMPIVMAQNGPLGSDNVSSLPNISKGTKIIAVDNRQAVKNSVILPASDMQLHIDDKLFDFREGELFAVVDGDVIPIEFDAIANQFNAED